MMRIFLILGLVCMVGIGFCAYEAEGKITDCVNLDALPVYTEAVAGQFSSYDRTGGNDDGFSGKYSCLYKEGAGLVIFDLEGPGCLYRMWSANPPGEARMKIYFDNEDAPRVDMKWVDYFNGKKPFAPSVAGPSSGGFYSYYPIPFAKRCKIVIEDSPVYFYAAQYLKFPEGSRIESFSPEFAERQAEEVEQVKDILSNLGENPTEPRGLRERSGSLKIAPGSKRTMLALRGAGIIYAFVIKPEGSLPASALRRVVLRAWWDDEETPSIEAPIGDFFGCGFGERFYKSLPLGMTEDGYYCYFRMPFGEGARFELENGWKEPVYLSWQVKYKALRKLPDNYMRFHAKWRHQITQFGKPYKLLEAKGAGKWVGVMMSMQSGHGIGYLEGDERIYIDGSKEPVIHGTGTEDFFNCGWYFSRGELAFPWHGIIVKEPEYGRICAYRFFIGDNVPFKKHILAQIEHGPGNNWAGTNYASVAYWYQAEGGWDFFKPLTASQIPVFKKPAPKNQYECEELKITSSRGKGYEIEKFDDIGDEYTGGAHLSFHGERVGDYIEFAVPVSVGDIYRVQVAYTAGPEGGVAGAEIDGHKLPGKFNTHSPYTKLCQSKDLGFISLLPGDHRIRFIILQKDKRAKGLDLALDGVNLLHGSHFVRNWWVVGPFSNEDGKGFDIAYPPEEELDFTKEYEGVGGQRVSWRQMKTKETGYLDLNKAIRPNDDVVAYAACFVYAGREGEYTALLGSDDGCKMWVNGSLVWENDVKRPAKPDEDVVPVKLCKGWNTVLIKVVEGKGDWGLYLRIADPYDSLRYSLFKE